MPDPLRELLERKGALEVLRIYGLDRLLTDQDDAWLWACVLIHHWPAPWESDVEPAALRFGIGRVISEGEAGAQVARSGMEHSEEWCFERVDADHLRVVECVEVQGVSFMMMVASGNLSAMSAPQASMVRDYLDISRPTYGQGKALVHKGMSVPPNAGVGETRYWKKEEDGSWVETEEVFSRWLA